MPRQKPADKVEMLRRQQADITSKLKQAEAKARETKRDDEQRRERLAGRCVLTKLDQDPGSVWSLALIGMLDNALKRPADRALFPALGSAIVTAHQRKTAEDDQGEAESLPG